MHLAFRESVLRESAQMDGRESRMIALWLHFLKDTGRPAGKLSNTELASRLMAAQAGGTSPVVLNVDKIGDLLKLQDVLKPEDVPKVLAAIERVAEDLGHTVSTKSPLPPSLEQRYAQSLPDDYRAVGFLAGDQFGSLADSLPGPWLFFYTRPINDKGDHKPEIRCHISVFGRAVEKSTWATFLQVSPDHQWTGYTFMRGLHLYIICTDEKNTETAFFIVNVPLKKDHFRFAGVGAVLLQPPRRHQPVGGIVCFGQPLTKPKNDLEAEAISLAMTRGQVSKDQEEVLRQIIPRAIYENKEQLRAEHAALCKYLEENTTINGDEDFSLASLLVSWP
jgi:hypothetical protein